MLVQDFKCRLMRVDYDMSLPKNRCKYNVACNFRFEKDRLKTRFKLNDFKGTNHIYDSSQ